MGHRLEEFVGARLRFQRLTDAKLFSGWLLHYAANQLRIGVGSGLPVRGGERFSLEIHGTESTARMDAVLLKSEVTPTGATDYALIMLLQSAPKFIELQQAMRKLAQGISATLVGGEMEVEARVVDLSLGGAGIAVSMEIARDADLLLRIQAGTVELQAPVKVANCRMVSADPPDFRVGLKLGELPRLERTKWQRLVEGEG